VDKAEARRLLTEVLEPLRNLSYRELVERFVDCKAEHFEVEGKSGIRYQGHVLGFWDEGKPGPLRVTVDIDDGGWRSYVPLCDDFIKAEDGTFIGE
jgi:hypothetical protein